METDLTELIKNASSEEATEIRKALRGKSKYKKKGVYREKENKVRFLDPDEWEKFIYSVSDNLRKYYWFLLLTGMRYKEAKTIQKKHINWKNREIIIFKAKGGVQRFASYSSFGKKLIRGYFEGLNNNDTINFPTIQHLRQTLHNKCEKLKIPYWKDLSVHNLRKQHRNYLRALNLQSDKIDGHLGHTAKMAQEHYDSSAFIKDKKQIDKIRTWLGDIFGE